MKKITFADRLRYWFDNTMSKGPIALIAWLGILSLVFILVMTLVITLTGIANPPAPENPDVPAEPAPDLFEIAWRSLMRTLDAGTMGGDAGSPAYLLAMLIVTLGGVFIISILIGVLTSGIEAKLEDLRKGRSFVVEQNHTLILGWSPQVFTIISELCQANANQKNPRIVILADQDKVEMEDAIRAQIPTTGKTRIVCRTGSPLDLADLAIVNPHAARAIIIVAPAVDDPDTHVIKTMLAITNNPKRKKAKYHIVAEIRDPKNVAVAKMVGRDEAEIVLVGDLISRITVQTCRQSGLSIVYTELLNFGGDEIYFKEEASLAGKQFGSALLAFDDSAVIGLLKDGKTMLNPPMDTRIEKGDQVIAISADDDTIKASGSTNLNIAADAIQPPGAPEGLPERTLILGWNKRGASIVRELDHYVAPASQTTIVAQGAAHVPETKNQKVIVREGDTTDRQILDALDIPAFNHVIVLSYSDALGAQEADAQTLITLLHLRDLSEKTGKDFSIVSEMLDVRNRELAEVTRADDFIVSDQLVSLMLSQVAENKYLSAVFADLFDPEGSEVYLKPVEHYVQTGAPVNFYTIVEAARRRGEVAFGYRLKRDARDAEKSYGVRVNPKKSQAITVEKGDKVIVLAES
ncbi:MAG: NAD-binding protein [Chloroflexi bacterium]|nr:NAD-binding protein [Chloroflexota bacterium]